jgi:hypothetical protein
MAPGQAPQRRVEERRDGGGQVRGPAHGDGERRADRASDPVRRHQVARLDGPRRAARGVAQLDPDAVGTVGVQHDLGAGQHAHRRRRAEVAEQHGLQVILGHARRPGRADERRLLAGGEPERQRGAVLDLREGVAAPSEPLDVHAPGADPLLQPE